ncbi:heme-binding protein [Ferruginibacter sp. HRS2-29]|uniref:GlcG/HbpS family heme-binding protein n=1 Tax=Ferruginibacter sp. HRS2-29 TaxID=2487334 RepID=UPI0020CF55D3|nr:heme-binding protein [Ferruginibacter sp. HRS2-29]
MKAKTSRYFDMNSGEIGKLSQPGGPLYQIEHSNGGLISFPGGVVLKNKEGEILGAIGVSGGSVEQDHEVATAGAEAL